MTIEQILKDLSNHKDEKYANFQRKIIKTNLEILGIRTPCLRKIVKNLENIEFLKSDKREIYELNLLEGFVISSINLEFKTKLKFYESYIKRADNWALIDAVKFKKPNKDELFESIKIWLKSEDEFIKRAAYVNLLYHFVDNAYLEFIFSLPDENKFYYDMMGHAWLVSECMAKFPDESLKFLRNNKLNNKTLIKSITKCIESFRVEENHKKELINIRNLLKK